MTSLLTPPAVPTVVVHLTDDGMLEAVCADAMVRVVLVDYTPSEDDEDETTVTAPDGDPASILEEYPQIDRARVAEYLGAAKLPARAQADGRQESGSPVRLILEIEDGRSAQLITSAPGVTLTVVHTRMDGRADPSWPQERVVTLPDGRLGLPEIPPMVENTESLDTLEQTLT